jgi:hypothetical protein
MGLREGGEEARAKVIKAKEGARGKGQEAKGNGQWAGSRQQGQQELKLDPPSREMG